MPMNREPDRSQFIDKCIPTRFLLSENGFPIERRLNPRRRSVQVIFPGDFQLVATTFPHWQPEEIGAWSSCYCAYYLCKVII
jgi:hypothetical protein